MKKEKAAKTGLKLKTDARSQEYPERLTELEAEIKTYPSAAGPLSCVTKPKETVLGKEPVVEFKFEGKTYYTGHADRTYSGVNHVRGVRHIRYYDSEGQNVLAIEGDFEDQQFGSNFKFHNIGTYLPGDWEIDFMKITDELRALRTASKEAFKKKRASETGRTLRGHSRL